MRKAIITGASSGLGKELGVLLQKKYVDVVNVSRSSSEFQDISCDLSSQQEVQQAISCIKDDHDDVDLLVLNAGIMPKSPVGKIDFDVEKVFRINLTAHIHIVNSLVEAIKKNRGDIVVVGSVCSFKSYEGEAVYSSTKFGLLGLIQNLQTELAKEDVRVIGVHPGGFNSNLRGGVMKDGYMDPSDIATMILHSLELPRRIEVSEIILNRKKI
ncbi:MAG: SDR family oxidoreductase [Nanoarchaeota archaeon]